MLGHGKTSKETPWLEQDVREGGREREGGAVTVAGRAGLRGRRQDLAFTQREVGARVGDGQRPNLTQVLTGAAWWLPWGGQAERGEGRSLRPGEP